MFFLMLFSCAKDIKSVENKSLPTAVAAAAAILQATKCTVTVEKDAKKQTTKVTITSGDSKK